MRSGPYKNGALQVSSADLSGPYKNGALQV
jgi:hypothetical protein